MSEEQIKEEIESIGYKEFYRYYIEKHKLAKQLSNQLQQKENIIKEVREEVRIYEEQSNDGTTNELDNYVFVQRLKKVLDKEVN